MATLLDPPKPPNPAKVEEFVEKQLRAARRRFRVLDYFMAGLTLAVGSLVFVLAALLVDRYIEMPRGTWWAVVAGYMAIGAGFLYLTLFRPDRRQINPYFAARQVEQTVPNAKNSLVTWVDFEEDPSLPGSIRTAIGQKAARDLKTVDLNRAIENRGIIWLAVAAAVFLVANVIVAVLPPTRTELTLDEPRNGDTTVFSNQDVSFQVRVHGRIPGTNDADAVRVRMWYNPDDPEAYEDRPMKPAEDDRRKFALTVPAKQARSGFRYKVLAGNTETPEYTVTVKIIPEFTGFDVTYEFPAYLKQAPETRNDPNILAPFGSNATIVATTNRDVKHGHIEIEGLAKTLDGRPVEGRPDAIQFTLPVEKEGFFRIWFTTPEGDKNQDPARLKLVVIDPKPVVRTFDLAYDYPAYLRFKQMTAADVREPEIEAPRGTKVVMTAKTTRGVKDARLEINGQPPIAGEPVADEPTWVRFKLPPIDKDGIARLTFTPTTGELPSAPRDIPIRALLDEQPRVQINKPEEDTKDVPATGTLQAEGLATDDHGVDKLTLRMKLLGAEDKDLAPKPYRGGKSFLRKEDNSWPTRVEYKDFVKLPDIRMPGNPNWRIGPGMEVEYWLEAVDNCTIPHPNTSESNKKRFKVIAPKPPDQAKIEKQNKKAEQDQQKHERRQDENNATEKRDVQQPPPKGAEQGEKRDNPPQDAAGSRTDPMGKPPEKNQDPTGKPEQGGNPMGNPDHEQQTKDVEQALNRAEQDQQPGSNRNDQRPQEGAKVNPDDGAARNAPQTGPDAAPPAENRDTKGDPTKGPMDDAAPGAPREGKVDQTKEEKGEAKDGGETQPGMEEPKGADRQTFGGQDKDGRDKPDSKDAPPMGAGSKERPEKGQARNKPQPKKGDSTDPTGGDQAAPGAPKPDKDVTASDEKRASGEPGPMGDKPPQDAAADRPKKPPEPGGARPDKKNEPVADKGGSRQGPKDEGSAGEEHTPPMGGDQQAKGGTKGGPGSPPPPQAGEQGELEREHGELEREISSTNPKFDENKQAMVDRLMRNPETREKTRQKLKDIEKNANDELTKKKARDALAQGEQAAKDYDAQRPNPDNVEQLSKQLGSDNERDRKDAEQRIKDWEKDPQKKQELQAANDELKKRDRNAGERVDNAMQKAEQARNQSGNPEQAPKVDEKQLAEMAKGLSGKDDQAKADAQKKMDQIAKDPKAAKDAQERLQQMADKAQDPKDKQDLQKAANQMREKADQMAQKGPPKAEPKVDPKALKDAADKLASGDEKTKQEGQEQLDKLTRDPKAAKEAADKLREMAENAKTQQEKEAFEKAAQKADQMAKDQGKRPGPKLDPQDLKDIAKNMAGDDPAAKEKAEQQMRDLMKDPKNAEKAKQMLEEMAKNAKNSPQDQKALDEAIQRAQEMAKNGPPPINPEDLKDVAEKLKDMDPKAKEELKRQLEDAMKDPERRKELEKTAQEMAKNMPPEQKKQWDDMMRSLGGDFVSPPGKPEQADLANKLKSAELLLDKFKKNVTDEEFQKRLGWTKEQEAQWIKDQEATIAAMRKQMENSNFRTDRTARSAVGGGPTPIKLDPKAGNDPLQGGRYAPPSGYVDPYKRFTGGGSATEPKR
jgi:collagen type III alpha